MKVIATTEEGFLIEASTEEIQEILCSVTGERPNRSDIRRGQKIPAIDYARTIRKIKSLKNNHCYKMLKAKVEDFSSEVAELVDAVENAAKIEV